MTDTSAQKKAVRAQLRRQLAELNPITVHDRSLEACRRLIDADFFASALTVMVYLPMPDEIDTTAIALRCFQLGKTLCAPRLDWERRRMRPVEVRGFDDNFEIRHHRVREPVDGCPIALDEIDLVIVPGLAFDAAGRRLGRGGGFYDRFLAQSGLRPTMTTCGLCFDFQMVDSVPVDDRDVRLSAIATDRRLLRTGARNPA